MSDDKLKKWVESIDSFVISDIRKALELDMLETSLIILCLVGIETLSGYYVGKVTSRASFTKFVADYFPAKYKPLAKLIYSNLRNGLIHNYIIKRDKSLGVVFLLNRNLGEIHLSPVRDDQPYPLWFNRAQFAQDFIEAWNRYLEELNQSPELIANWKKRVSGSGYMLVGELNEFGVPDVPGTQILASGGGGTRLTDNDALGEVEADDLEIIEVLKPNFESDVDPDPPSKP